MKKPNLKKTTKPIMIADINRAHNRKMNKRKRPAAMTVNDLIKDEGVPLHVRHWLLRFVDKEKYALAHSFIEQDADTLEQARLIFDVLESSGKETGERKVPKEAVDYIEEYLYRFAQASEFNVWNLGEAAVAALPVLLECSAGNVTGGDSNFIALDAAIYKLTTHAERQYFLRGDRYQCEASDVDGINGEAAFKRARVLADPTTPDEMREEIELQVREFSMSSNVIVEHPALIQRAFMLMCEAKPIRGSKVRSKKEMQKDRGKLLALLDSISEEKGGES